MESTKSLPTCEQFLERCLLTPTVTDGEPCAICLENYEVAPVVTDKADQDEIHLWHTLCQTPTCSHKFGFSCLFAWAKEHSTCPMCRTEMYYCDEEEERSNPSLQEELMIGPDFDFNSDADEDDLVAYWASLDYDADDDASSITVCFPGEDYDEGDFDGVTLVNEEEGDDCTDMAQRLRRLDIESGGQTAEEVEDWVTGVEGALEASQRTE